MVIGPPHTPPSLVPCLPTPPYRWYSGSHTPVSLVNLHPPYQPYGGANFLTCTFIARTLVSLVAGLPTIRGSRNIFQAFYPPCPHIVGKACPLAPPHRWCSVSRTPTPLVKRVLIPYAADTQMVCTEQTDIEGHDLGLCPPTPLCSVTHLQSREGSGVLELGILSRIPVCSVRVVQCRRTSDGADIGFYH